MRAFARLFRLALFASLLVSCPGAEDLTLITPNSGWRYFRGTAHPSPADAAAWRKVGFNDTGRASGSGAFLYGEPGFTGTELTDMANSYPTIFRRRRFTLSKPASIESLDLSTVCDDGFAAYPSGTRAAAFRAPDKNPDHTTLATAAEGYDSNTHSLTTVSALLVPGEGVLAEVVMNGWPGGSDLVFDAELVAQAKPAAAPRIFAVQPSPGVLTNLTGITVIFSEPVTGVEAQHFLVNGVPAFSSAGSGNTYTFIFAKPAFGGVQISWGTLHQIRDLDIPANRFDAGAPGSVWSYELLDPVGPAIAQRLPAAGLTVRQLAEVEVTFNRSVNGVDAADLRRNGMPASTVTGIGPGPYRFTFPTAANGVVNFTWAEPHGIESNEPEPHPFRGGGWTVTVNSAQPAPQVVINEFLADNATGLADEDSDAEDWIELHNRGTASVSLEGWSLSNDSSEEGQWVFPAVTVPPGGYLVVFASGKDRRPTAPGTRLHTNFKLNATGDTLRLFGPELPRPLVSEVKYPAQGPDHSYGRLKGATEEWRYLNPATPGAVNGASTITGRVKDVRFSVQRGFFDRAFNLSLSTPTAGATIRYTTNGSLPALTNGAVYTGPLTIAASRVIRAAAFATNQLPSAVGTHTYLFNLSASRRLLPAISLVSATNNLYGRTGIMEYNPRNTDKHGPAWERPASIELIRPEDNGGFQMDAGLRVAGGDYIRTLYNYRSAALPESKYSFRLYFRGDYGPGKLDYPLFPGTTAGSFNNLHLRAGMNDHSNPFLKDEFVRALCDDMGLVACHGTFVNLFLNGVYRGIYNPTERVDDDFLQRYHGGGKLWDVIGPNSQAVRGDTVAWNQLRTAAALDLTVRANFEGVAAKMDLANFVDYLLPHIWADNDDWPHNNTRAAREKKPGAKFRFYPWDAEFSFGFSGHPVSHDTIANTLSTLSPPWGATDYQRIFNGLGRVPEFKLLFADRVHRAFFNGGPLTDERLRVRYGEMKARVAPSISGFSDVVNTWINGRRRNVTNIFQRAGFLLSSNAPVFPQFGGAVPAGFSLTMSNLAGTVYYTTNGTDPRTFWSGTPTAEARTYASPLILNASTRIMARSLAGTNWSALSDASFTVTEGGPTVRFSELMYHPIGGDAFEFIELHNAGGLPVDLSECSLTGVTFRFLSPFPALAPGVRIVLANDGNPTAFAGRYPGVTVAGWFGGSLSNGGERLALLDRDGRTLTSVTYSDDPPWPARPDGLGASLELVNPAGDPNDPANWQASAAGDGSPGKANSVAATPLVRFNEVLAAAPPTADWLELRNRSNTPVNLAGWSLTDNDNPRRYVFPPGCSLAAGGYLRVFCGTNGTPRTGFGLSRRGETLALFDPRTNRVDAVTFGPSVDGYSLGRIAGNWTLCEPTPAAVNEAATLGNPANLRLNEYLANGDTEDDWIELHNLDPLPVAVQGACLGTSNALFRVTVPVFVAGGGFVALKADENPGSDHVDFKLTAAGDALFLRDANGRELDRTTWRKATAGVATGRLPDGSGAWTSLPFSASPGASNYLAQLGAGLRFNEVLARAEPTGTAPQAADWIELQNPTANVLVLAGYSLSVGRPEPGEWVFPPGTQLGSGQFLRLWATTSRVPGALNLGRSLRNGGTRLSLFDDRERLLDQIAFGPQLPNQSIGRTESGWALLAAPTPGGTNSARAALGNAALVRINEWLADGGTNSADWIELHNPEAQPVGLGGFSLTDDPSLAGATNTVLAALSFIPPRGFLLLRADGDGAAGPDHLNFRINAWGETVRVYDSIRNTVDSVTIPPQVPGITEGRFPDGGSLIVAFPDVPTPGASNRLPATDGDADGMPDVWELLHGLDPADAADAHTDADGDGASNLAELLAGTDPRNASSVPTRLKLELAADGTVTLRFPVAAGRSYRVVYADTEVGGTWQTLVEVPPAGASGEASTKDFAPPAQRPVRFYRLLKLD
jgi:hypothetical protein